MRFGHRHGSVGSGVSSEGLCCNDALKGLLEQPPDASHAGAPVRVRALMAFPLELALPM